MLSESELNAALAKPYSGPTFTRKGANGKDLTYIPWEQNMAILDEMVGAANWSHEVTQVEVNPRDMIYVVGVKITIEFLGKDGVRSISRGGVGRAYAGANKPAGAEITGQDHDLAAAAAESDALSRAAKKFGRAFGSDLIGGEKKAKANGNGNGGGGGERTASSDKPVSDKQLETIRKAGTPESVIKGLKNAAEASDLITQIKNNGWKYPGGGVQTPDDLDDDY